MPDDQRFRTDARSARACGEVELRIASTCWFVVRLIRPADRRVDFREGWPTELSSAAPPFLPARLLKLCAPAPTGTSRRDRFRCFGFFGPDRSAAARARSAFVAMIVQYQPRRRLSAYKATTGVRRIARSARLPRTPLAGQV